MPHTYHLERRQFIPRPLAEVFAFFADAGNLETITPPSLNFRILTPRPIVLRSGALIDYRLTLLGVPFRWRTRIESFDPPHRFTDVQVRGPYRLWHHTHEFTEQGGGTLMVDRVDYQLRFGPLGWLANRLFVERQLRHIFDCRYQVIDRLMPAAACKIASQADKLSPSVT
ncbi:MAG: SRPBCC family protein [Planctomycetaceae bacterium]|nr:SRPBCC family protein [Planctomycetaceae bacterium]